MIELIQSFLEKKFPLVFWDDIGDAKGPTGLEAKNWTTKVYTLDDYKPGKRVGLITGVEIAPGKFLCEADIDWAPLYRIALHLLPGSLFSFGRESKPLSHIVYTTGQALPSFKYVDPIDNRGLIELRGTKVDGSIGCQTMIPPSVWQKEGVREPLVWAKKKDFDPLTLYPTHYEDGAFIRQAICLTAIGMLLAKHLGKNGFGHETRLAWAGFLLRAGIPPEDLIKMGAALSEACNNLEADDVRLVVESTASRLGNKDNKVKGGPALAKILGLNGNKIIAAINGWLGRDSDFLRNKEGVVIKDSRENINRAIDKLGITLAYDDFAAQPYIEWNGKREPFNDNVIRLLRFDIESEFRFLPTKDHFNEVLMMLAYKNPFHPVKDYLASLTWDGVPRVDSWLIRLAGAPDDEYVKAVGHLFLVAAVRRVRQPGCKFDEMVILEGKQGKNKSTAFRTLCGNDDYFSDDFPMTVDAKKIIESTAGKWIIEASELSGRSAAAVDHIKSMMSRQHDGPARLAYDRQPTHRKRHFIVVGSTNLSVYLNDPTGGRRFWPIPIKEFNIKGLLAERDQLWAEAAHYEAKGESIRMDQSLWGLAETYQESRREEDEWEPFVEAVVKNAHVAGDGHRRVSRNAIYSAIGLSVDKRDAKSGGRISKIMSRLGYRGCSVRFEGGPVERGFISEQMEKLPLGTEGL